jgi:hypothetical protein
MLTLYVNEIIGNDQCGFRHNRSNTDQIFYIRQILEKNGSIMGWYISYLLTSRKPMTQLREKFFTIFCDHQCEFPHNRSTTNQIFYIWQILEKKMRV